MSLIGRVGAPFCFVSHVGSCLAGIRAAESVVSVGVAVGNCCFATKFVASSSMQIAGLGTRGSGTCGTGTAVLGHAELGQFL